MEQVTYPPTLEASGIQIAFSTASGDFQAVDGVSLSLWAGRTLGLVGESGCGKSLTALSLLKLVPPPARILSGHAKLNGVDLLALDENAMADIRGQRISMIFQEPMTALNPVYTVGDQVAEAMLIHGGANAAAARSEAIAMLDRVGIPDAAARADSYPHQLSGGMRQRVMIAMALVCRPQVLVADEPTTALDVTIQAQILDLILEMQQDMGLAVLFISHNLAVVSEIADEVMVMYAGRIVEHASADDLLHAPLHPYTRALIDTLPDPAHPQTRLATIPGQVPAAGEAISGCRFAARCALADAKCLEAEPILETGADGRQVACWKAGS